MLLAGSTGNPYPKSNPQPPTHEIFRGAHNNWGSINEITWTAPTSIYYNAANVATA